MLYNYSWSDIPSVLFEFTFGYKLMKAEQEKNGRDRSGIVIGPPRRRVSAWPSQTNENIILILPSTVNFLEIN